MTKHLLTLTAAACLAAGGAGLAGCQDKNKSSDMSGSGSSSMGRTSMSSPGAPAGLSGSGQGTGGNIDGNNQIRYGTEQRQGTLSGGTAHDPNANTMGGG